MKAWWPFGLVAPCIACGSSNSPASFADVSPGTHSSGGSSSGGGTSAGSSSSGGSSGGASSGGLVGDGGSASSEGGVASNCAQGAGAFIYVISDKNNLYTFDPSQFPSAQAFALIGNVSCDTSGVNSMAVDRAATAWVNFNDGLIFQVSTTAPVTCTPTSFVAGQAGFTRDLGMGFSVNAPGSNEETLFVSDNGGPGDVRPGHARAMTVPDARPPS